MRRRSVPTALTAVPLACLVLGLAGCGSDAEPAADGHSAEAGADALPITAHVLAPDALPGLSAEAPAKAEGPRAFAREHDKDVADLRASGFVSGATVFFKGPRHGFALSVAGRYDDQAAARTEADRLFASNADGSPGMSVETIDVPGVTDAQAAVLSGAHGGRDYTGVEIVFVDGTVVHEVFALGEASTFTVDDVVDAVSDLHERVAGHPLG